MPGSDSFIWAGGSSGDWNIPAEWEDLTTGQNPAGRVPGSLDVVTIGNGGTAVTVSGNGNAASISLYGTDAVLGTLNAGTVTVGTLTVGSSSVFNEETLDIPADGTVEATSVSLDGTGATGKGRRTARSASIMAACRRLC